MACKCFLPLQPWSEGLIPSSQAWPGVRPDWHRLFGGAWPDKLAYGCWFNWNAFGSGIFVNVGRSLRARRRSEASRLLNATCPDPPHCYGGSMDFLWCTLASRLGYDTIQVQNSHAELSSELIVCGKGCATVRLNGTCPPGVALRDASGAACNCSEASARLNCGGHENPGCEGAYTAPLCGCRVRPPFC